MQGDLIQLVVMDQIFYRRLILRPSIVCKIGVIDQPQGHKNLGPLLDLIWHINDHYRNANKLGVVTDRQTSYSSRATQIMYQPAGNHHRKQKMRTIRCVTLYSRKRVGP